MHLVEIEADKGLLFAPHQRHQDKEAPTINHVRSCPAVIHLKSQ